jgi:uncharacterized membrane protein
MVGPVVVEFPFAHEDKWTEQFDEARWLKGALESTGEHQVTSVPAWDFYRLPPGEYERVLGEHDLLIFSDVEGRLFQVAPTFFGRPEPGQKPLVFADRARLTIEAVHRGMGALFLGGRLSFSGELGRAGWGRTRLNEILPLHCLDCEDVRESTDGFTSSGLVESHEIFKGIDLTSMPPVLGYNVVRPREHCPVLAHLSVSSHPLLSVGLFGEGRTLAYLSDPAPHWGYNFVCWSQYAKFWLNACRWTLGPRA